MMMAVGYYLAVKQIAEERNYKAISLKDVDGMKKLCGFPPAPIFMLLSEDGYTTVQENDSLGALNQGILNVSKVKTGPVTMSRLTYMNGKYLMQMVLGNGKIPPKWEECGWG